MAIRAKSGGNMAEKKIYNHSNAYVGPQIRMNPKPILGLPDLETDLGSPRSDSGIPVLIVLMPFQFGDETLKSQIGTNPKPILVSD